nr:hypothetical protein BaRGS_006786 [Batillaria attramentaria]
MSLTSFSIKGRLGNWLFHYASSLALAKRLNAHLVMLKCRRLNRTLESTITNDPDLEQQCADAEYVDARFCCVFYPALFDLPPNRSYVIDGYLQSWRYFSWCDAEVRKALTFKEKIVAKATSVVQTLRNASRGSVLVGVHVRRGDYLKEHMSEVGRKAAPANYFHRAMAYFQEKCGKRNKERRPGQSLQSAEAEFGREGELGKSRGSEVEFVVACADDAGNWCETNLLNKTAAVSILPPNSPAVDMLVLSMLDHVIISVGTFSWWVGYLSRGTVVYYKDFVEAGSRFGKEFGSNLSDYMPPSWIPIS